MAKIAVVAITKKGLALGEQISRETGGSVSKYTLASLAREGWHHDHLQLGRLIKDIFPRYQGIILIMATGIAVRTLAPILKAKDTDPAIVVMDEANRFAISLVSGHLGGANSLATELGELTGCQPVITTATDLQGLKAVDVLARELDLKIEPLSHIKYFNGALLKGEELTYWVEEDLEIFTDDFTYHSIQDFSPQLPGFHVLITHRQMWPLDPRLIYLRPKNLFLGVGCRKDFPPEDLQVYLIKLFAQEGLSLASIGAIGTIHIKKDERAIKNLAQGLQVPLLAYPEEEINALSDQLNIAGSQFVESQVGVRAVAEPCSLLAGNTRELLLERQTFSGSTLAIAIKKPLAIKPINRRWFRGETD